MIKNVVLCLFLLSLSMGFSQNKGILKGKVIDFNTREALVFANVLVDGTQ